MRTRLPFFNLIVVCAAIFAVLALRVWQEIFLPTLGYEDGIHKMAFFFNHADPSSVFRLYKDSVTRPCPQVAGDTVQACESAGGGISLGLAEYLSLAPNGIAWVATRGPTLLASHVFTLMSLSIATAGIFLLTTAPYSWLVQNAVDRQIVALLLALLPLGMGYLLNNLTYSQWNLLFLSFVLLARPLPQSVPALLGHGLATVGAIISHPLSILVLPLCLIHLRLARRWSQRVCVTCYICVAFLYQTLGVGHSTPLHLSLSSLVFAAKVFVSRVCFETVFGAHATTTLIVSGSARYVYLLGMVTLAGVVFLALADKPTSWQSAAQVGVLVTAFALVFASGSARYTGAARMVYLEDPYLQRYVYVPKLMFAVLLLSLVVPYLRAVLAAQRILPAAGIWVAFSLYLLAVNIDNSFLYDSSELEGKRVTSFLIAVDEDVRRARSGVPYTPEHALHKEEGWDVVMNIDQHLGK